PRPRGPGVLRHRELTGADHAPRPRSALCVTNRARHRSDFSRGRSNRDREPPMEDKLLKRDNAEDPHPSVHEVPGLTEQDVAEAWARGTVVTVPAVWSMVHEHEPPDNAYLILEGRTRV